MWAKYIIDMYKNVTHDFVQLIYAKKRKLIYFWYLSYKFSSEYSLNSVPWFYYKILSFSEFSVKFIISVIFQQKNFIKINEIWNKSNVDE
jgi:hypothetical protein